MKTTKTLLLVIGLLGLFFSLLPRVMSETMKYMRIDKIQHSSGGEKKGETEKGEFQKLQELAFLAREDIRKLSEDTPIDTESEAEGLLEEGIKYMKGEEVKLDKFKAFSLLMDSARKGSEQAQKQLDRLCKESPWACKEKANKGI